MLGRLRHRPSDAGAMLVEFGLLLPLFIGIVLGGVTGGIALFSRLQATTAAQEGARALYVGRAVSDGAAAARAAIDSPNFATTHTLAISVDGALMPSSSTWKCTDVGNSGKTVTVRVTRSNMRIQWLVANTPVVVQGRAVTRCP